MTDGISLMAAATVTGKSKRTLWRRVADGLLPRLNDDDSGRTLVALAPLVGEACLPMCSADWELLCHADAGEVEAQVDIGLLFWEAGRVDGAFYWMGLAAKQQHPDAMHWLAYCCFTGQGCAKDEQQGMVWLSRSAAKGHPIAMAQMAALRPA